MNGTRVSFGTVPTTAADATDTLLVDNASVLFLPPGGARHVLSDEQTRLATAVLLVVRYVAIALAVPPTVLNVVVFLQREMRGATRVYVIGISAAQLYYVTAIVTERVLHAALPAPDSHLGYWTFNLYFGSYGVSVARRGSYLAACLVSAERLYAIARPLHVKTFLLSRRPVSCLLAAFALAALLNLYIPAKVAIRAVPDHQGSGAVRYGLAPTSLFLKHKAANDAFSLAAKVLLSYAALLVQIVLNVLTVCFLKRHNLAAKKTAASSSSGGGGVAAAADSARAARERQMTVTILATTVSYVVLSLPWTSHNVLYTIAPEYYSSRGTYSNLYSVVYQSTLVLVIVSCGTDFLFFMALSSNYRRAFCRLFGFKERAKRGGSSETATHELEKTQSMTDYAG